MACCGDSCAAARAAGSRPPVSSAVFGVWHVFFAALAGASANQAVVGGGSLGLWFPGGSAGWCSSVAPGFVL